MYKKRKVMRRSGTFLKELHCVRPIRRGPCEIVGWVVGRKTQEMVALEERPGEEMGRNRASEGTDIVEDDMDGGRRNGGDRHHGQRTTTVDYISILSQP